MTKSERHAAIRERAAEAIRDMYHNATPRYPSLDDKEGEAFQSWFEDAASFEIEYLRDGGAYGRGYRHTLERNAADKFKSEKARGYYVRKGMRDMHIERARCNRLDSRGNMTSAQWERIGDYGKLYQYGRGGRTLAPDMLVNGHGGSSFSMAEDYCDDMPIADVVTLILIVESFNAMVAAWCKSVPEQWNEAKADFFIETEEDTENA